MDWRIGGVYKESGQRRLRSSVECLLLAASCATFATACGELYYDPDPPSAPEETPRVNLVYYRAYRGDTAADLAEGCVAVEWEERSADDIVIPAPLGIPYILEFRTGSRKGSASSDAERKRMCELGPDYRGGIEEDPRCWDTARPSDELLQAEVLDDAGVAVPSPTKELSTYVDGDATRFVLRSSELGVVSIDRSAGPCKGCSTCSRTYWAFTLVALDEAAGS